jgi:hypothetical protein
MTLRAESHAGRLRPQFRAGLHGIVTLHNDRHNALWPPLDELLVHLTALHTGQQPDVIAEALRVTAAGD